MAPLMGELQTELRLLIWSVSHTCLPVRPQDHVVPSSVGFPKTMLRSVFDFVYDTILPINLISSSLCCYLRVKTRLGCYGVAEHFQGMSEALVLIPSTSK